MKFAIYEEYPVEDNLSRLSYINFPADLVVASKSLKQFNNIKRQIKQTNSNIERVGYWPTLKRNEGYWFSAFSDPRGVKRVLNELEGRSKDDEKLFLKFDAELPHQKPFLVFKNLAYVLENKNYISNFLKNNKNYNLDVVVAEFPNKTWNFPLNMIASDPILKVCAASFDPEEYNLEGVVKMAYTSFSKYNDTINKFIFGKFTPENFRKEAKEGIKKYDKKFSIAIGAIAKGEMQNEPILNPDEFYRDLKIAKEEGVEKSYIFRLGGLDSDYVGALREFYS